jgi:serine/threonine protein phosphatase PrpC
VPRGHLWLLAVADGLGGHPSGDVASRRAIDALRDRISSAALSVPEVTPHSMKNLLAAGFDAANREVMSRAAAVREYTGMGSTLVAVLMDQDGAGVTGNVGDSRAYLLSGTFRLLTTDHSMEGSVRSGDTALSGGRGRSHIVTRAIGVADARPDVSGFFLDSGRILLCSDGLGEGLSESEIGAMLGRDNPVSFICRDLVAAALHKSTDNVSVVVAERTGG